jgi:hypothetical protein
MYDNSPKDAELKMKMRPKEPIAAGLVILLGLNRMGR